MAENIRWTPEQITMFEKAKSWLQEQTPALNEITVDFNITNNNGLTAVYRPICLSSWWGVLNGYRLSKNNIRAERNIEDPNNTGVRLLINPLSDKELEIFGELALKLSQQTNPNLRIFTPYDLSEWKEGETLIQGYNLKPDFNHFR